MLSRWFKPKEPQNAPQEKGSKTKKPVAMAAHTQNPTVQAPGLLEQLSHGQPIETLTDMDVLNQLVKHSDKLDKRTNRSVRERINTLREQEKTKHQQHEQQEKICTRLETLAKLQHHPLFDSELAHLQQQWQLVDQQDANLLGRVQQAVQRCLHIQQEAIQQKQAAAAAARQAEQLKQQQAEQALVLAAQHEAEMASQAQQSAEKAQAETAIRQARQQSSAEQQKALEHITRTAEQQLAQLEEAITQSDSKKARQLLDRLRDTLKQLDHNRAQRYDGKLHLLQGQLRELQDWQDYAALPKLEALCVAMEKLVAVELPAPQKAEAVRELQNQWREIKTPPSKKSNALWERFKKAGDKAWEPCAVHFEKEKQVRCFNLQQRQAICEALEQFHTGQDWEKADWKAVSRILEKAKKEFHDFHPVERSDEKPVRQRFDAALGAVQARLLVEQQANEGKKQHLIDTAASLNSMTDIEKAIERAQQLQEQWKTIGLTRRHEDHKLWQRFQEQCNALFAKRKAAHQQQWQAQNAQMDHAKTLCEAIHALAKLPDSELASSQDAFDNLQTQFKAIKDIPVKNQAWLKKHFHEACDHYRSQFAGISKRQRDQQWQQLTQQAALCAELEQRPTADKVTALAAQWQPQTLPADWKQALQQRWNQALALVEGTVTDADRDAVWQANEKRRRNLCIELEILLDVETPEEDRQLRREYQMQRLAKGIGQGGENPTGTRERLLAEWYCCGPANPAVQAVLEARFNQLPVR